MQKLRWGVLGAGGIADRRTLPGMMEARNAELTAVMEIDEAQALCLRDKYNAKRAYTSAEELMKDPEIDAVYIASPVEMHGRQACMAADHGKHILLEKPLALTAAEARDVITYCQGKGVQTAVGFMMRFGSYNMAIRQAITQGKIGQVVSCHAMFSCWYPDIAGAWRQKKTSSGGGALMDMGVHCIDLLQYITGSKVRQVAAMHDTLTFHYEVEDSSAVLLRLENGALCTVQAHFNIPDKASKWQMQFFGTCGHLLGDTIIGQEDGGTVDALFLDESGVYSAQQDRQSSGSQTLKVAFGNMYTREIESFSHSILMHTPLEVPASDAVQVQEVVEVAYRANEIWQTID